MISDDRLDEIIVLNNDALERLKELIVIDELPQDVLEARKKEINDQNRCFKELLTLRKQNKLLIEDGERLASLLPTIQTHVIGVQYSDKSEFGIFVRNASKQHKALMESIDD